MLVSLKESTNPGALLVCGDALYHLGRFEHSLVSYYKSSRQSDYYHQVPKPGVTLSRDIGFSSQLLFSTFNFQSCRYFRH